jgi:glycosyltransferase involved in cell wall biosynthesis
MGGSQSALCYLARVLARQGHEIFLVSHVSTPGTYDGVHCLSWKTTRAGALRDLGLDALVNVLMAGPGKGLRKILPARTRLILWNQHAPDQQAVEALRDPLERDAYDGMAMVSDWQRAEFARVFGVDPARMGVLRNAIAPAFAGQFAGSAPILPQKQSPPVLVYTSTPYRGLDLLLAAFPEIRRAVPGARLHVFSSMKVYQMEDADAQFSQLYEQCRRTEGVEYIGSVPQPKLADALHCATMLAYPNTFTETSCISVMEAMASGCHIVTSDLAALPETTAGFARLIPPGQHVDDYLRQFVHHAVELLRDSAKPDSTSESHLRRQVDFVNTQYTWEKRAGEWVRWLESLPTTDGRQ